MSIRTKTLFIIGVTLASLICILYLSSKTILLNSCLRLEEYDTRQNVSRALDALNTDISSVNAFASDWAEWDDTYAFVQNHNSSYIETNLALPSFTNNRVNFMIFADLDGNIVKAKAVDLTAGQEKVLPNALIELLQPVLKSANRGDSPIKQQGIILLPEGPVIVASHPILTSKRGGPRQGTLIAGRYLDNKELQRLGETTHLSLFLENIEPAEASQESPASPQPSETLQVQPLNGEFVTGYAVIDDIYGKPVIRLGTRLPRHIYQQGLGSLYYFLGAQVLAGLIIALVIWMLLNKAVIFRLASLNKEVSEIGISGNLNQRVEVASDDELTQLARSVNAMLDALEHSEQELTRNRVRYQAIVEDQTELICRYLPDGTLTFANLAYCRYFGLSEADYIKGSIKHCLLNDLDMTASTLARQGTIEHCMLSEDGQTRWQQWTNRAITNEQNQVIEYQSVGRDISDLKRIEQELKESMLAAQAASQAKSDFLANVSHEIRTPMSIIIGMTDLLLDSQLNDAQAEFASLTKNSAYLLLSTINDILDFSKIEAGSLSLENITFELKSLVDGTVKMVAVMALQKGLTLEATLDQSMPRLIIGDPVRLHQVLLNLLGNAVKFTDAGGVYLSIKPLVEDGEPLLLFEIKDTGIGLSSEEMMLIFDPFTQADNSNTRKYGGTGLGLTISRHLIELMGGEIGVKSVKGSGSTFFFTIPAMPCEGNGEHYEEKSIPSFYVSSPTSFNGTEITTTAAPLDLLEKLSQPTVLIADDNPVNCRLLALQLNKLGYASNSVGNGRDAVKAFATGAYKLVLMDCQMPLMDGFEATRVIREREKLSGGHIPIIAVTAGSSEAHRQQCLNAGMDDYLRKPVDKEGLKNMLEAWMTALALLERETNLAVEPAVKPGRYDELDTRALEGLQLEHGEFNPHIVEEIIEIFLTWTPPLIEDLTQAVAQGDPVACRKAVHNLKQNCRVVGALNLAVLCEEIEKVADEGFSQELLPKITGLQNAYANVYTRLTAMQIPD